MASKKHGLDTLILCVDRDDDVSRKTAFKGPVVGRENNLKMASALALADPEDSDANTVFEAVRTYDNLKKDKQRVEVVTVTGHQDVGVRSDTLLSKQLDDILEKTGAERVVLVTDGLQDEHIIPLIQTRAEIVAINRVVMKQSERLEGMYYMVQDFVENPKMAKIVLGVPALAFLLLAVFGTAGWRIIIGGLGLYLLVKGFQLEARVTSLFVEMSTAVKKRRISFLFYVASMFIGLVGIKGGYDFIRLVGTTNGIETIAAFIHGSILLAFLGFIVAIIGRLLSAQNKRREISKHLTYAAMGLGVTLVGFEASNAIISPEIGFVRLLSALVFSLFVVGASRLIERVL